MQQVLSVKSCQSCVKNLFFILHTKLNPRDVLLCPSSQFILIEAALNNIQHATELLIRSFQIYDYTSCSF